MAHKAIRTLVFRPSIMIGENVEIAAALVNIEELVAVASIIVRSREFSDALPRTLGII